MTVEFAFTSVLWLLALIPLVWLVGPFRLLGRVAVHRRRHACVRSLLLASVVCALAQPVASWPASRTAVIYLVDASDSVASSAWRQAADTIDAIDAAVRPDVSRILAFAGATAAVADTATLRRLATPGGADELARRIDAGSTDLEQALAAARAEIDPSMRGRIVLFSDGRETRGDPQRAAEQLAALQVPVFTWPVAVRDLGDTWIDEVRVPEGAVVGGESAVEVVVGAQVGGSVEVVVADGGRVLARRRTVVAPGTSSVTLDVRFSAPGAHLVEATVLAAGDTLAENNTLSREVIVAPPLRVLYVHDADGAGAAPRALAEAGTLVTMARPEELPAQPAALEPWDVVVISDVARARISPAAMHAVTAWVEDLGGGLLFVGGHAVIGESADRTQPGYRRSEIERVLPVTFDRDDEPDVALVIVLDRSWSMYGQAMDLTKAAAEAAANTLTPGQMVGVLSFNNNADWDVPLARMRDARATLHEAIARISASGPTAIYPALQFAYEALADVRSKAKHVILLSDGQTAPEDFQGLVAKMKAASITVSSVALGPEADATLLGNIATWGAGRSYVVQNAAQIPEIFVTEAKNAGKPKQGASNALTPIVRLASFFPAVGSWPALEERNVVTRKPDAVELLGTSRGDPLLTIWPAGLGRTAMFAADVDGRWTKDWLAWRGFGAAFSSMVRALAPGRGGVSALDVVAVQQDGARGAVDVTLDARDARGDRRDLEQPEVVVRQRESRAVLRLTQSEPGRYVARVPVDFTAPLTFSLQGAGPRDRGERIVVTDRAAEYRFGRADAARLRELATTTGGAWQPTPDDLRATTAGSGRVRHELAGWLLGFALLLWPVDIALRRLW